MPKRKSETIGLQKPLITPRVDLLCGGGLSLTIALLVIIYGRINVASMDGMLIGVSTYLFTDLLINGPHFMASYRVLYSRKDSFSKHPLVTLVAPLLAIALIAYVGIWTYAAQDSSAGSKPATLPNVMIVLNWLAPILLGWHYVGQSWGATACFAFLAGFRMSPTHRRLIRCGFYALFVYHVTWACKTMGLMEAWFPQEEVGFFLMKSMMSVCRVVVMVSFVLGLVGFWQLSVAHQRAIPATVWLPWVATYSWYVMVDVYPQAFFLLQVFHALQYLMFPLRVEMNEHIDVEQREQGKSRVHLFVYYVVLVAIGYIVFEWTSVLQWTVMPDVPWHIKVMGTATMMMVNIHHYFIDAVIWKIRDPVVRQSVFGHLEPSTSVSRS